MKKITILIVLILFSCQDDDVCVDATTPNLVVTISDETTLERLTLDTLYVEFKYSETEIDTLQFIAQDSFQVPLKIDNMPIGFGLFTSTSATKDSISMSYDSGTEYVSKACGLKQIFNNVNFQIENATELQDLETLQNTISTDEQVHLNLLY